MRLPLILILLAALVPVFFGKTRSAPFWLAVQAVALAWNSAVQHEAGGLHAVAALVEVGDWADLCLVSGGLGPTSDDLTAEAVARACGVSLQRNAEAEAALVAMFARFGRPMPEINRKQADLPAGAGPPV